eukprot:GCRY01003599.1.p1 GENE.GCRY01003599.1~~GCRY01003599.1.p1  ORF type:complete len:798 (-),score=224.02 GCRY01003599.1:122-2515(-)
MEEELIPLNAFSQDQSVNLSVHQTLEQYDMVISHIRDRIHEFKLDIEKEEQDFLHLLNSTSSSEKKQHDLILDVLQKRIAHESFKYGSILEKRTIVEKLGKNATVPPELKIDNVVIALTTHEVSRELREAINQRQTDLLNFQNLREEFEQDDTDDEGFLELTQIRRKLKKILKSASSLSGLEAVLRDPNSYEAKNIQHFINTFYAAADISPDDVPLPYDFSESLYQYMLSSEKVLENQEEEIKICLENFVFAGIYHRSMELVSEAANDQLFADKCLRFKNTTQAQMGIADKFLSDEPIPFLDAITKLRGMSYAITPTKKLYAILSAAQSLYLLIEQAAQRRERLAGRPVSSKQHFVGGDEFLDLWVYIVLQAAPTSIFSNLSFIEKFAPRQLLSSELGYYFSSTCLAASYILELTSEKLKPLHESVVNKPFLVFQIDKYKQWAKRDGYLDVLCDHVVLKGYQLFVVEQWFWNASRFYCTVPVPSPDKNHTIVGALVQANRKITDTQQVFLYRIFFNPSEPGISSISAETSEGPCNLLVAAREKLPGSFRLIEVPNGDYDSVESQLEAQSTLRRFGVKKDAITLPAPRHSFAAARFYELFNISDSIDIQKAMRAVLTKAQGQLRLIGIFSALAAVDGCYSDITMVSVRIFQTNINKGSNIHQDEQKQFETLPTNGTLTPETVRALDSYVKTLVADLTALGYQLPAEPETDRVQTHVVIQQFQKDHRIFPDGYLGTKTATLVRTRAFEKKGVAVGTTPTGALYTLTDTAHNTKGKNSPGGTKSRLGLRTKSRPSTSPKL